VLDITKECLHSKIYFNLFSIEMAKNRKYFVYFKYRAMTFTLVVVSEGRVIV